METLNAAPIRTITIESEIVIDASPERVFDAIVAECAAWFEHRIVAGSPVVSEPIIGGRMYEDWGDGQGMLWATFTGLRRPTFIRTAGAWGIAGPVQITVTFRLEEVTGGTRLTSSHVVIGDFAEEAAATYRAVAGATGALVAAYLGKS